MWSNILLCNLSNVISSSWSMHTVRNTACKKQNPSALMGITWLCNSYTNWGNLSHSILMLQKTYVPPVTHQIMAFLCIMYLLLYHMTDGTIGENNHTYFFIFICGSVVALSSPYVPIEQLPCSVATVDCDVGVNLSTAHLLIQKLVLILAF